MLPELTTDDAQMQLQTPKDVGQSAARSLRIPELDGIRGIAILLVIMRHYLATMPIKSGFLYYALMVPVNGMWSGVDLFFVLSGYLIGGILLDQRETKNYFQVFYIRRFYRIIPLYAGWLTLYLVSAFLLTRIVDLPDGLIQSSIPLWTFATLTQNFAAAATNSYGPVWLGITWSLAVEEQFYLTLPLFLYLVPRKQLPYFLIALIGLAPVLRWLHIAILGKGLAMYVLMPYRIDTLLLGVLCAWMVREAKIRSLLERFSRWLYLPFLFFAAWSYRLTVQHPASVTNQHIASYGFSVFGLMYTLFVLIAVTERRGVFSFLTRLRPLRFLGLLAYALYLFHETVNVLMHHFILNAERGLNTPAQMAVTALSFLVVIVLAYLSWIYFEKPLVAIGHRHQYIRRESTVPQKITVTAPAE